VNSLIVVTNAVFTCTKMSVNGPGGNTLNVLSKGTLDVTAPSATETNGLGVSAVRGALTINAGTINAVSGTNAIGVTIGGSGTLTGCALTITNGGKLLSELGTIGANSSYCTGVVTGVGSVWSNFTDGAGYVDTNRLTVGGGLGSFNYLAVRDGATLVNNGSLNIGSSPTSTLNSVVFGGPGQPAVISNSGTVNIGSGSNTYGNSLTVSNASLTCDTLYVGGSGGDKTNYNNSLVFRGGTISANYVKIQSSNNVTFTAGILSAGGLACETGANNSNAFVVGDGTSAAYYDMAASGTGYHDFNAGGLVVTSGAYLRGTGTIAGNVTVLGIFAPGFSVGSIFFSNNVVFGSGAALNYDLGTSSDSAATSNNLTLAGMLNVTPGPGFGVNNYTLFTYSNLVANTLAVTPIPGFNASVVNDAPNTRILLVVTAIAPPDPFITWQSHYFPGGGTSSLGTADPDGDGVSNTNEFLSSFNPTNGTAYAHIIKIVKSGPDMSITYLGANGDDTWSPGFTSRTNVLEYAHGSGSGYNGNYANNNFVSITGGTNILGGGHGTGTVVTVTDTGAASATNRYYRIRVIAP
jgi:hypothetical protein